MSSGDEPERPPGPDPPGKPERLADAVESLRRQNELLQKIFDHIPVMIHCLDESYRPLLMNRESERVLGWSLEEAQQGDIFAECYPDPAERQHVLDVVKRADSQWVEFKTRARDGRTIDTAWTNMRLSDGTSLGFGQDLTDRRRLEEGLRQSQKVEAVARLAGGIAHDFNNILAIITGQSEMLRRELGPSDPRAQRAERIRKAAERATVVTRQLLAFSRRQVLKPRVLDLAAVVRNVAPVLRRLVGEEIEIVTVDDRPSSRVKADPGQIEQVLMSLVVNARDAMPRGGTITLETADVDLDGRWAAGHPGVRPGPHVMLAIGDTGTGMDAEVLRHVFEPFFTTKQQGRRTGLGLAMVYGVVKQSEGYIAVKSEPGVGTRFEIYLPLVDAEAEPIDTPRPEVAPARGSETILVAEDEEDLAEMVREILEELGYRVLEARSGLEALEVAAQHGGPIHLLLTDVVMPGLGGRELAERLLPLHPEARVLFMSGYTDDALGRRGILEPDLHFIQKPFGPDDLASKLREVLS